MPVCKHLVPPILYRDMPVYKGDEGVAGCTSCICTVHVYIFRQNSFLRYTVQIIILKTKRNYVTGNSAFFVYIEDKFVLC
jgi:hypothetical protein